MNDDASDQDDAAQDLRKQSASIEENIHSFEENIHNASSRIHENEKMAQQAEDEIRSLEKDQAEFELRLAQITDDIVAELDAGLKKAGYSASERRTIEAALNETLGKVRTVLSGREVLIRDLAAAAEAGMTSEAATPVGSSSLFKDNKLKRIAEELAAGLAEAAADAQKAIALFENYRNNSPLFLDEFLAPEGIITKKRTFDTQIRRAKDGIEERRQRIKALYGENTGLSAKINEYRVTLEGLRVNLARVSAQAKSAEEQAKLIRRELAGQ